MCHNKNQASLGTRGISSIYRRYLAILLVIVAISTGIFVGFKILWSNGADRSSDSVENLERVSTTKKHRDLSANSSNLRGSGDSRRQRPSGDGEQAGGGEIPRAFLGGATELDSAAIEFLGLSDAQSVAFSEALVSARDEIAALALSRIAENPDWERKIDMKSLQSMLNSSGAQVHPDEIQGMVAASYTIPAMKDEGDKIEEDLRSKLVGIVGKYGDVVVGEVRQSREFLDFGGSIINMLLIRQKNMPGYSVYLEFRVAETGKWNGGAHIPFAAFNKRFGNFFHEEDVSDDP